MDVLWSRAAPAHDEGEGGAQTGEDEGEAETGEDEGEAETGEDEGDSEIEMFDLQMYDQSNASSHFVFKHTNTLIHSLTHSLTRSLTHLAHSLT